jgi:kumamolisin
MSSRNVPLNARYIGKHVDAAPLTVTMVVERGPSEMRAFGNLFHHAADLGLTVTSTDIQRGVAHVTGPTDAMEKAFDVELHAYQGEDESVFAAANKEPTLPAGWTAVLGLDQRPLAKPYFKAHATYSPHASFVTHNNTYNPYDLGILYNFPSNTTGKGQTIAIIELGGGFDQQNLRNYFHGLGLPVPTVIPVSVMGTGWSTGSPADGEVQLDIQVAGCLAPDATYMVYFAPNTDQGFHEAISQAIHHPVHPATVISISWGGPENNWGASALKAVHSVIEEASSKGIPVTVAAGDNGASDGEQGGFHADFPAASPACVACGGTRLIASRETISMESVWNDSDSEGATGGGVSQVFARPVWQADIQVPFAPDGQRGRGLPDVAAVADPETGYYVLVNGEPSIVGGTSAVAPLWAALIARLQESLGKPLVNFNQTLYKLPGSIFRDITRGDNDGYKAVAGWDPTTGRGSPNGEALLAALKAL